MTTTASWAAFPKIGISRSEMEERGAAIAFVLRARVRAAIRTRNGPLLTNFPPVLLEADQATLMRRPVRGGSADSGNRARSPVCRLEEFLAPAVGIPCTVVRLSRCVAASIAVGPVLKNALLVALGTRFCCRSGSGEVYANAVACQCKIASSFREIRSSFDAFSLLKLRAGDGPLYGTNGRIADVPPVLPVGLIYAGTTSQ